LDGLANNGVLNYYKTGKPFDYLTEKNIKWIIDAPIYFQWSFGKYFGKEIIEKHFRLVNTCDPKENSSNTNNIWLVQIH
jgi:hypothetical protein